MRQDNPLVHNPNFQAAVLDQLDNNSRVLVDRLDKESRQCLFGIFEELRQSGKSDRLDLLWELDYVRKPVGPMTFVLDEDYAGKLGKTFHDKWLEDMEYVLTPKNLISEHILTGAIGIGKTSVAVIEQLYKLYLLSCLLDPQTFYGLGLGSTIVFGIYNITLTHADDGSSKMRTVVDSSPYFREHFPRDMELKQAIRFPQSMIEVRVGSLEEHELGEHMYGLMMDEANFYKGGASEQGRAHGIYTQTLLRQLSRFLDFGRLPGLFNIISSSNAQTDYLDKHIKKIRDDPELSRHTHISSYSAWEVATTRRYSGRTFRVVVGSRTAGSRILDDDEVIPSGERVINVPVEYHKAFVIAVDKGLRNVAGVSTLAVNKLVKDPEAVLVHIDSTRKHPFKVDPLVGGMKDPERLQDYLLVPELCRIEASSYMPKMYPYAVRHIHIDGAKNNDAFGFGMGSLVSNEVRGAFVYVDFLMRVRCRAGDQIDWDKVRQFVLYLAELGYNIGSVSGDQYQSLYFLQLMEKRGYKTFNISVDRDDSVYTTAVEALLGGRVDMYGYNWWLNELFSLNHNIVTHKVDHPEPGEEEVSSKDVTDAWAAVVTYCLQSTGAIQPTIPTALEKRVDDGALRFSVHRRGAPVPEEDQSFIL